MEAILMALARKNIILIFWAVAALLLLIPGLSEARLSPEEAKVVWSRVAKATELTDLPFNIKQETVPNAWVTNGSSVTVTTGLLELLDTQSELYGVLSHEAGHAKLNHYENTVKRGVGLSVAATLFGQLFGGGIAETAKDASQTMRDVVALRERYLNQIQHNVGPRRQHNARKLLTMLFAQPIVSVAQIKTMLNCSVQTANELANLFHDIGIFRERTGDRKNRQFVLGEYFDLFDKPRRSK